MLIIGASGFTGQRILHAVPSGWSAVGMARSQESARVIQRAGVDAIKGDLNDPRSIGGALREADADAVICVASLGFGHARVLTEALVEAGAPRCVFTSTTAIFTSLEPASKRVRIDAEATIHAAGIPATIVRPTMIYGRPGDRNMERLLRWLARVPVVVAPEGGRALQQPVHVDDLAASVIRAAAIPQAIGLSVNVPGPAALSFSNVIHQAGAAVGRRGRIVSIPTRTLRAVVAAQEAVLPRPRLRAEQIDRLVEDKAFDPTPAMQLLGHEPRPFDVGIAQEARLLGLRPSGTGKA